MIHGTKKVKFKDGQDSNTMIMRKLMYNFLRSAHLTTTEARAKALKMYLDRILSKTKEKNTANKNYLLKYFNQGQKHLVDVLFEQVGPAIANINGGYVKIVRLNQRQNDGSMMADVRWAHPVVITWKDKKEETKKSASAKAPADKAKKEVKEVKKVEKTDEK